MHIQQELNDKGKVQKSGNNEEFKKIDKKKLKR